MGYKGIRYAVGGLASCKKDAIDAWQKIVDKRNRIAPNESMRVDAGSFRFNVTEVDAKHDKETALRSIPKGLSAIELADGEIEDTSYILHRSLEGMLNDRRSRNFANIVLM